MHVHALGLVPRLADDVPALPGEEDEWFAVYSGCRLKVAEHGLYQEGGLRLRHSGVKHFADQLRFLHLHAVLRASLLNFVQSACLLPAALVKRVGLRHASDRVRLLQ